MEQRACAEEKLANFAQRLSRACCRFHLCSRSAVSKATTQRLGDSAHACAAACTLFTAPHVRSRAGIYENKVTSAAAKRRSGYSLGYAYRGNASARGKETSLCGSFGAPKTLRTRTRASRIRSRCNTHLRCLRDSCWHSIRRVSACDTATLLMCANAQQRSARVAS